MGTGRTTVGSWSPSDRRWLVFRVNGVGRVLRDGVVGDSYSLLRDYLDAHELD